ncbi:hypothetical protein EBR66_03485 [bacterium]|nr:hypothetical protein [bacterium]
MPQFIPHELLARVESLLSDPFKWVTGVYACDSGGNPCEPTNITAAKFNPVGALVRVTHDLGIPNPEEHIIQSSAYFEKVTGLTLAGFCDTESRKQYLAAMDVFIKHLKTSKRLKKEPPNYPPRRAVYRKGK